MIEHQLKKKNGQRNASVRPSQLETVFTLRKRWPLWRRHRTFDKSSGRLSTARAGQPKCDFLQHFFFLFRYWFHPETAKCHPPPPSPPGQKSRDAIGSCDWDMNFVRMRGRQGGPIGTFRAMYRAVSLTLVRSRRIFNVFHLSSVGQCEAVEHRLTRTTRPVGPETTGHV